MVDKDTPKEFAAVLEEIIDAYFAAEPKKQKELLNILRDANKCKEKVVDGNYTKDPAETSTN
jgi:Mg2+/Co2+ transporter CorC